MKRLIRIKKTQIIIIYFSHPLHRGHSWRRGEQKGYVFAEIPDETILVLSVQNKYVKYIFHLNVVLNDPWIKKKRKSTGV